MKLIFRHHAVYIYLIDYAYFNAMLPPPDPWRWYLPVMVDKPTTLACGNTPDWCYVGGVAFVYCHLHTLRASLPRGCRFWCAIRSF